MPKKPKLSREARHAENLLKQQQMKSENAVPSIWGTSKSAQNSLNLLTRTAYDAFVEFKATKENWETLAERVNVFTLLVQRHFNNPDVEQLLVAAEGALRSIRERYRRTNQFGWSGEERNTLTSMVNVCEEIQANALRRELMEAYAEVSKVTGSPNRVT